MTAATATTRARAGEVHRPAMDRETAMRLAKTEYSRYLDLLRRLSPADWDRPTCCAGWDVRAMTCHVVGMAEFAASTPERFRQLRAARRAGGLFIDALTGLQVAKHAHRPVPDLVDRFAAVAPKAARGRRRTPAPVRRIRFHGHPEETWTIGYLTDAVLTRDTWMHRIDVAAATGHPPVLTPEHDGVLVADVVRDWADRHGRPYELTLDGPAGGSWHRGEGGPAYRLDAVEFCRILSGRVTGEGLLATPVPF